MRSASTEALSRLPTIEESTSSEESLAPGMTFPSANQRYTEREGVGAQAVEEARVIVLPSTGTPSIPGVGAEVKGRTMLAVRALVRVRAV